MLYRSCCPGTARLEAEQVAEVNPRVKRDLKPREGECLSQGHTAQARWTEPGNAQLCSCYRIQRKGGIVSHVMPVLDLFLLFGSSVSKDHDQPQGVNGHRRSDQQAAST